MSASRGRAPAVGLLAIGLFIHASCGSAPKGDPKAEALAIWGSRCANCHGPTGAGDGPAGRATSPPPRDFRDPQWQEETSDSRIRMAIHYGGAKLGLNPAMAPNPDLVDEFEVTAELVKIIRGFGEHPPAPE
jgi:mono/diheme cytochrome c family protein